jgi:hypothetical protein
MSNEAVLNTVHNVLLNAMREATHEGCNSTWKTMPPEMQSSLAAMMLVTFAQLKLLGQQCETIVESTEGAASPFRIIAEFLSIIELLPYKTGEFAVIVEGGEKGANSVILSSAQTETEVRDLLRRALSAKLNDKEAVVSKTAH